jgi:Zn ribbon nucleic-acid-binding protein
VERRRRASGLVGESVTRINEKMGLKPQTRTRQATHSRSLVTNAKCPECRCTHVVQHVVHGQPLRLCGACGHTWHPEATP